MSARTILRLEFSLILFVTATPLMAQNRPGGPAAARRGGAASAATPVLPNDPKLLKLHRQFVREAEQLATDYEQEGDVDRARAVYNEILKLVPAYPRARARLAEIRTREATADKKRFEVRADKGWQDTGVIVKQGKPIRIAASGVWTWKMTRRLGPDGMEIPAEVKDFPLGSLIGIVVTGEKDKKVKPFLIGPGTQFMAKQTGRLLVRMHDPDPGDNEGLLDVDITGTFEGAR